MRLNQLFLWPRFRKEVKEDLDACHLEVIELHVEPTPTMKKIQEAIVKVIKDCLEEINDTQKVRPDLSQV